MVDNNVANFGSSNNKCLSLMVNSKWRFMILLHSINRVCVCVWQTLVLRQEITKKKTEEKNRITIKSDLIKNNVYSWQRDPPVIMHYLPFMFQSIINSHNIELNSAFLRTQITLFFFSCIESVNCSIRLKEK